MLAVDSVGHGPPVVLLHGVGSDRSVWRATANLLAGERSVLAPDLPGFGGSRPIPGGSFELGRVAATTAAALRRQVSIPFDLVGNSLGGAVALILADRHPKLVRRLVLVAPAGLTIWPRPLTPLIARGAGPAFTARRVLGAPMVRTSLGRRMWLWSALADPAGVTADDALGMVRASRGTSCAGAAMSAVLQADLRLELKRLAVPAGVIWGEQDRVIPVAALRGLLEVRPDLPVTRMPRTGHVPQLERPAEFAWAVQELLERLGPG